MRYLLVLISLFLIYPSHATERAVDFTAPELPQSGHIVIPVREGLQWTTAGQQADQRLNAALSRAAENAGFTGKAGKTLTLFSVGDYARIDLVGVAPTPLTQAELQDFGGAVATAIKKDSGLDIQILAEGIETGVGNPGAHIALGFQLGDYAFKRYKRTKGTDRQQGRVVILVGNAESSAAHYREELAHLAKGVAFARDIGNEPGNVIYPESFVERTRTAMKGLRRVKIEVMAQNKLERLGMGALLGVGAGSAREPRLLIVDYRGRAGDETDMALVGKGISFDTGGISIKPNKNMWKMKSDLSGAAAVMGTLMQLAAREAAVNVVAVAALAENMPSGTAIRPGDVLTSLSGKTIEIMSTDAEGRLVLADAVTYVQQRYKPALLVDVATLTGSAARALGDDYGALFTRDDTLTELFANAGTQSGETVWPLPLNAGHYEQLDSLIADLKNTADKPPGASTGAAFIGSFIDAEQAWVHLDIAGVDWRDKALPTVPKGHAGWGVRLLDQVIRIRLNQ
ncbi:leucyl aminopeptidase [Exilibacterium tricleocarpae]|uniref:Probable cytosol aminopeptidase n=1 Tax=Exilibacterium tricleocarpae TaxID=2591008 RepID=A0A545TLR3_9GAMM|nr:leucyl aminopeptidase [Exilibacterium tricleocarpae]TQV78116.1 leucyl aminopeptidase [Exilibacterium tricleocarpae]